MRHVIWALILCGLVGCSAVGDVSCDREGGIGGTGTCQTSTAQ